MSPLEQISILDIPDEIIEVIMIFLTFSDLFNLSVVGKRFEGCAERVMKKKPFKIAIIGGSNGNYLDDVEMISIQKDSISRINSSIPSLPKVLWGLRGTQLPNGDLLVCGGVTGMGISEYRHYKEGSNQWTKVGTMKGARSLHSSVWIDGRLLVTGGTNSSNKKTSYHEEFSFDGGVKERKELPIALYSHTATIFGQNGMIVSGGFNERNRISQRTFIYNSIENSWFEGPSLLTPRAGHSSCAIRSDDGSTHSIIIIGGTTDQKNLSKTTELLDMITLKWIQGPELPLGIKGASCVALPPTHNFACVLVGGWTKEDKYSSNVYGLNRSSKEWTPLGKIRTGRYGHIALPFS